MAKLSVTNLALALMLAAGCGDAPPPDTLLPVGAIELAGLEWTSVPVKLGRVAAVAESGDELALYTDTGVFVFSSGSSLGSDNSIHTWRGAADVPALGFSDRWLLAVDGEGRLHRLRNHTALEEVTALYGLGAKRAQAVAPLGDAHVAFSLDGNLAVADGQNLVEYSLPLRELSGGNGRVATLGDEEVQLFDVKLGTLSHLPSPGVKKTAFTTDGTLWATTETSLLREHEGALQTVFTADEGESITDIAASKNSVWLALTNTLAVVRGEQVLRGSGVTPKPGTRLHASPTGDVWAAADEELAYVGDPAGAGADAVIFRKQLLPIFERLCQACHLPSGSAHIDLSSYSAWASRREAVKKRVVDRMPTPMPPNGSGMLTAEELEAVRTWAARPTPP